MNCSPSTSPGSIRIAAATTSSPPPQKKAMMTGDPGLPPGLWLSLSKASATFAQINAPHTPKRMYRMPGGNPVIRSNRPSTKM